LKKRDIEEEGTHYGSGGGEGLKVNRGGEEFSDKEKDAE